MNKLCAIPTCLRVENCVSYRLQHVATPGLVNTGVNCSFEMQIQTRTSGRRTITSRDHSQRAKTVHDRNSKKARPAWRLHSNYNKRQACRVSARHETVSRIFLNIVERKGKSRWFCKLVHENAKHSIAKGLRVRSSSACVWRCWSGGGIVFCDDSHY